MTTLFISDLHLSDYNEKTLVQFEQFISGVAAQADALYILGDLFEVWVGDDDHSTAAKRVAKALHDLAQKGTKIFYVHGNRDFLISKLYADQCAMTLLTDPTVVEVDGKKVLITHGDLLCTDDHAYQTMRKVFHNPWVQKIFLALPRSWRENIGKRMRDRGPLMKPESVMDVNADALLASFRNHPAEIMVHGHTHKPAHHQIGKTHRYVLGAWDIKPMILVMAGGQIILKDL
jgi:UDP-2,3-diacylglucosamine hydrolase